MNLDGLVRMLGRMLFNRALRGGIDHVARGGKDPADMTPEERKKAQSARQTARRAQQALRMGRRIGRF